MLHPRHRGDCTDFYFSPHQTERLDFKIPDDVRSEVEHAAARAGRTFNDQIIYIAKLLRDLGAPDFDDERIVEDWDALMSPCRVFLPEAGGWIPLSSPSSTTP